MSLIEADIRAAAFAEYRESIGELLTPDLVEGWYAGYDAAAALREHQNGDRS